MSTHLHESLTYVYHIPTNLAFELPSRLAFQILPDKRDNLDNSKKTIQNGSSRVSLPNVIAGAAKETYVIIPPRTSLS